MNIIIDKRMEKFVEGYLVEENVISIYLNDIRETFHFDNEAETQSFLNKQVRERFGDCELKEGFFDYKDEDGTIHRYFIGEISKEGKISSYMEEIVL